MMTVRAFTILAFLTALGVALAGYAVSREPGYVQSRGGDAIYPQLNASIDDVAKIVVRTSKRKMTMMRGAQGWVLVESGGYPVQSKIIKAAILGFSSLTYVEPKTRQKSKYYKLELQDPEADGAKSRGVRIFATNGDLLVDTVLGRVRYNMPGTTRDGIYLRTVGDDQAWLALGQLDVSRLPSDWLRQEIMNIGSERIKSVSIRHPDGEVISVSKTAPSDRSFFMAGIPETKQLKYDGDPDAIASVLEEFELSDVKRQKDIQFQQNRTIEAQYKTFDGLIVDIRMTSVNVPSDGETGYWVALSAKTKDATDEIKTEAGQINARVSSWAYRIPGYKASRLNKRLADMLKDSQPDS